MKKRLDIPNPFEYQEQIKQLKKLKEKEEAFAKRIQEIAKGDQPADVLSWEYYIWKTYNDPLSRLKP